MSPFGHLLAREYSFVSGSITVQLVSSLTGLDYSKQENMLLFVFSEPPEFNPV